VTGGVGAVAANRDGSRIVVSDGYDVTRLYDTESGREVTAIPTSAEDFGGLVSTLALSGDGSKLAVGGPFETVKVFDIASGTVLLKLSGSRGPAERKRVFAIDDVGKRVAAVVPEGELTVYELDDERKQSKRTLPSPAYRIAFSRDGKSILIACFDRTLQVWDAATLTELARIPYQSTVRALTFGAKDSRLRILSDDGTVRDALWRTKDVIERACAIIGRNFSEVEWSRYFPQEPFRTTCQKMSGTITE